MVSSFWKEEAVWKVKLGMDHPSSLVSTSVAYSEKHYSILVITWLKGQMLSFRADEATVMSKIFKTNKLY